MTMNHTIDSLNPDFLNTYDFSNCLVCGTCSNGCPTTGAPGLDGWGARKVMRMLANGLVDEVVASNFPWLCTGCGRCTSTCPGGIDITSLMGHLKSLRPREDVPGSLHKGMTTLRPATTWASPRVIISKG